MPWTAPLRPFAAPSGRWIAVGLERAAGARARTAPAGGGVFGGGGWRGLRRGLRRVLGGAILGRTILGGAILALAAGSAAVAGGDFAEGWREAEIVRLSDGARLEGFEALVELAERHDVVVVGEIHDNPRHQRLQAALARALDLRALALEMVPAAAEEALSALRAADGPAPAALREAAEWDAYAPWHVVIEAVPQAEIAGAGVSREAIRRAMAQGAAAAFEGDAAAAGLEAALAPPVQAAMEAELFASHCEALPEAMLPAMVEAQRLRDAAFAAALLRARARAGGGPAMLATGDGHVRRDRGAPAYLGRLAPELSVLAVAQVERRAGETVAEALAPWSGEGRVFDVAVLTAPAEREDPCAVLRN